MENISIFWFRRDLRLSDNAGLYYALKEGKFPVLPIFIFDTNILADLEDKSDARVHFIHQTLSELQLELKQLGATILVKYGKPLDIWQELVQQFNIKEVFTNKDFEPYALNRDVAIAQILEAKNIAFHTFKDHVIFEKDEVLKDDGKPYTVFTPYSKKWLAKLDSQKVIVEGKTQSFFLKSYPTEKYFHRFYKSNIPFDIPTLEEIGFSASKIPFPDKNIPIKLVKLYAIQRDFPAIRGTSHLGIHFRFGTISIREKARKSLELSPIFLNELIWRDFYAMILAHFPHVVGNAFRPAYDKIQWRNHPTEFELWCNGMTGYPLVDAGMRELNQTGFMHNRVRMVVASFLTKHLLIDWRWGEAYFAKKLLDFDLSSNNGGWQWAAGCGTDAAPYFRIFNPEEQLKKFDKSLVYIKKWIPEYGTSRYPKPIVEHKMARERCLETYKEALKEK